MATDRSRSVLQAILVQDSAWAASCLAADSSYTGLDPLPGIPQPASADYAMTLSSGGSLADITVTLTVTTQQGGLPGRDAGATFLWDTGGDPYGWDAPTVLTGWQPIVWATSPAITSPHVVSLESGLMLAVWTEAGSPPTVKSSTWSGSGSWSAPVTIDNGAINAVEPAACLCPLPNGRTLEFSWIESNGSGTIRMIFSDDDGATWNPGSSGVLPQVVSFDATTGWTPIRTRAAWSAGQILLLVNLRSNDSLYSYADTIRQYASSDGGNSFQLVYDSFDAVTSPFLALPDIAVVNGAFIVGLIPINTLYATAYRLESAYQSISSATAITIFDQTAGQTGGTNHLTEGEMVLVADETGTLYCSIRLGYNVWLVSKSDDEGNTWVAMAKSSSTGGNGKWWDSKALHQTYPMNAAGCWHFGQLCIVAGHTSDVSAYDGGSLSLYVLGGYTSATMPGYDAWRIDTRQVTWGQTWLPLDLPGDSGWTRTVTGVPTESLSSGLLATSVTLAQSLLYSVVPTGTVAGGVIATWSADHTSGTSYRVRLRTADVGEGYQLTIALSSSTLTVLDAKSGSTIGTVAITGEVAILASITAGVASVWYRSATDPTATIRAWTRLVDSVALTDDAGATWTANLIDWGHPLGGAAGASWRWFHWIDDEGSDYAGTGLGSVVLPEGLLGHRYSSSPVSLDGSTTISAQNGPTYAGDSWSISVRYEYGPENIFPTSAPSPRMGLHLDGTGTNDLIFDLHTGSEATALLGLPVAMAILGTNAHTATLAGWDGAAWVTVLQWSATVTTGASYTRAGRMLVITSGGSLRYVTRNECAGWTVDLGGGYLRRVTGNTEGLIGGSNPFSAILQLEGVTGSEASSGTCTVYASDAVAIAAQPSFYRRFRLRFSPTSTPEGYLVVGKVVLGSIAAFSRRPANGRTLEVQPQAQTSRPPGGPRSWRRLGPSVNRYSLELADLMPTSQIFAASPSPDYVRLQSNGTGLAAWHGAALNAAGLVEENQGRYVVYLGSIPQVDNATTTQNLQIGGQILYGRLVEPGTLTIVRGNEASSEVHSLSGIILETEP